MPDDTPDPIPVAQWYVDAEQPRKALEALRTADPDDLRTFQLRARALLQLGRTAEAEEQARRALAIDPENLVSLEVLATVQLETSPRAAEATLNEALTLEPENVRLLQFGVVILVQQGRYEAAERMLERAMRIAPDECAGTRAFFLLNASRSEAARDASAELLRQFPDEAYSHYMAGLSLLEWRWWRALRHLRHAAALRPDDPLMVETARVMHSWYLWPVHLTSGAVGAVLLLVMPFVGFLIDLRLFLPWLALVAYRWLAHLAARFSLQRRIARALRQR